MYAPYPLRGTISNTLFLNNIAAALGGVMFAPMASLTFSNVRWEGNQAQAAKNFLVSPPPSWSCEAGTWAEPLTSREDLLNFAGCVHIQGTHRHHAGV